jgi:hypothetical protein
MWIGRKEVQSGVFADATNEHCLCRELFQNGGIGVSVVYEQMKRAGGVIRLSIESLAQRGDLLGCQQRKTS